MHHPDIHSLSPQEKRALLTQLLQSRAAEAQAVVAQPAPPKAPAVHPYENYVNPYLGSVLRAANMDKRYVRGEGCYLYDPHGTRYLDFTGAYGALPFGFNPPEICQAVRDVFQAGEPSFIQPSALEAAGDLAQKLIEIAPGNLRYVTLTNSGAETVEAAIKLARSATGRMGILSTENSFHGKTLGALSATGRTRYQSAFGAPVSGFARIPYGDVAALEAALSESKDHLAAFIVEPVQGEGGVVSAPPNYLTEARRLCTQYGVLLIFDEIQTGLGRMGTLFACEEEGVAPDILTLAKALGGGMVPIGAVLCTAECYTEEFAMKHTSTFANNTLCCRVGLRSLDLITRNGQELVRHVAQNGQFLRAGLERLQQKFPELIASVRGRGYLLGLELTTDFGAFRRQNLMSFMAEQESLVLAVCTYMLNVEHIRLAPTLFGAKVMRIEPPLIATQEMCQHFLAALERTLNSIETGHTEQFLGHLVGRSQPAAQKSVEPVRRRVARPSAHSDEGRWGFIAHPLDLASYVDMDRGLAGFSPAEMQELTDRLNRCQLNDLEPSLVIGSTRIVSPAATAYGELFGVAHTAAELMEMSHEEAVDKVRSAVKLAASRGAQIVGLGGYTSIVTQNGLDLQDVGVPLTTGNGYTVVSTLEALERIERAVERPLSEMNLAIVGATGSIGRALSLLIGERAGQLFLVGNPRNKERSMERLRSVAADLIAHLSARRREGYPFLEASLAGELLCHGLLSPRMTPEQVEHCVKVLIAEYRLILTTNPAPSLPDIDIVITATSDPNPLLEPSRLKAGAILCDVSRPSNISPELRQSRPDVFVLEAGIVAVPGEPDTSLEYGLPFGSTYACMAETMLLGLEKRFAHGSFGRDLDIAYLLELQTLAQKHQFRLADFPDLETHRALISRSYETAAC